MCEPSNESIEDDTIWRVGVFDAHCHPTDIMASVDAIGSMKARVLTVMSTRAQDQDLVAQTASRYLISTRPDRKAASCYVVPAFGWHPWFSYQLYDDRISGEPAASHEHYKSVLVPTPDDTEFLVALPRPRPFSAFLQETESRLREHPFALIGEVGIDRAFRLPAVESNTTDLITKNTRGHADGEYTAGSREGRPLTRYRVSMDHQKTILKAQLELAAKMKRPVSVHSVQAHGVVFDLLQSLWAGQEKRSKRQQKLQGGDADAEIPDSVSETETEVKGEICDNTLRYPPRICMHSYSGPVDPLKQFLHPSVPADVYFSFSEVINFSNTSSAKVTEVIKAVPENRILIESDLHCAGDQMDGLLESIIMRVCEIKGWGVKEGAQQLKQNWETFIFGRWGHDLVPDFAKV